LSATHSRAVAAVRALAVTVARKAVPSSELTALLDVQERLGPPVPKTPPVAGLNRSYQNTDPFFPDVSYDVDQEGLRGRVRFAPLFEGAGGVVHGGFVAAVFDHALGSAALAHSISRTASLTIDYRSPVLIDRDLVLAARVERIEGRKLWVVGRLSDADTTCTEAQGLFLTVPSY
jgi:acyl-coenzyme A thioesterase PaaI-like protein